jgi:hypothetical protein
MRSRVPQDRKPPGIRDAWTRGSLGLRLLPTRKQPSADEIAKEKAFTKKVQDRQDDLKKEAEAKLDAPRPTPGDVGNRAGR